MKRCSLSVPELCADQGLLHPVSRCASRAGTVGLRSADACDLVRERDDKVFGKHFFATTDFIMDMDEFFPDISNLYDDMGNNTGNANGSSTVVPYFRIILLVEIMMQF
jgi:hypothetical protein